MEKPETGTKTGKIPAKMCKIPRYYTNKPEKHGFWHPR